MISAWEKRWSSGKKVVPEVFGEVGLGEDGGGGEQRDEVVLGRASLSLSLRISLMSSRQGWLNSVNERDLNLL